MLIPLIVFGVLLLLLIFTVVKSADTWNWIPITVILLIFITGILGGISASIAMKKRAAWVGTNMALERQLASLQEEYDEALYGISTAVDSYGSDSLRAIDSDLRVELLGKGRVWDNGTPSRNGEQFTLTFNAGAGRASPASQILQDMDLFAFAASDFIVMPPGAEGSPPPADFVGSFKVVSTDAAAGTVTLEPVFLTSFHMTGSLMRQLSTELKANNNQDLIDALSVELEMELKGELETEFMGMWQAAVAGGDFGQVTTWLDDKSADYEPRRRWSLFEKMTADSRTAFLSQIGMDPFSDDNEATPDKLNAYRQALQADYLPAELMGMDPDALGLTPGTPEYDALRAEYEELLDQYTFDGVKVNEINQYLAEYRNDRVSPQFEAASDDTNLDTRVRFNAQSENFIVDGTGQLDRDGGFDINGGTNDPELQLGTDPSFPRDTEIVLDKEPAGSGSQGELQQAAIVQRNDAELMQIDYYRRTLRDYPLMLREYRDLTRSLTEQRRAQITDIEVTGQMIEDANTQIRTRNLISSQLEGDINNMELAQEEIARLGAEREAELKACRELIQTYYNQIIELYQQSQQTGDMLDASVDRSEASVAGSR